MYPVHLKRLFSACIPPLVVTLIYTEQVVAPAYTSLLFAHATTTYTKNAFPPLFAGKLQRLAQACHLFQEALTNILFPLWICPSFVFP